MQFDDTDDLDVREETEEANVMQKKFFSGARLIVSFVVVLVIGFAGGMLFDSHGTEALASVPLIGSALDATPDSSVSFIDFWEVWNALQQNYVITHASSTLPTTQDKMWGAIQGLTASYGDPYTVFFPPEQAKQFKDDITGSFGGIGVELGVNKDNILVVIAPLKDTPGYKAGLKPGDLVIAINGKTTEGMSTDDAVTVIRGPKGTSVTLTILRDGKPQDVKITRDTIQVPEIDYSLDQKTGVYKIALYEFTQNSADLFDTAFAAFKKSGSKKLVIDLRGNPGGYLDAAVAIASHFLPSGQVVVTEDYEGKGQNNVHSSNGIDDVPQGTQIVVLIDRGSASASEILSGALQDHKAATLIGTRSFGKGSVQQLINIDGASLKVTVARWLTPNGHSIMGNGITPDIESDIATSTPAGQDPQMDRAVEFLTTGK